MRELCQKLHVKITEYADISDWWDQLAKPTFREFCMDVSERLIICEEKYKKVLVLLPEPCYQKGELEGGDQGKEAAEEHLGEGVYGLYGQEQV